MKYVIYKKDGIEIPVIFPSLITHNEIRILNGNPVAAGNLGYNNLTNEFYLWIVKLLITLSIAESGRTLSERFFRFILTFASFSVMLFLR